ncbi:MAG: protein kinase [Phycisphaerae bacterium]|nr:protein kinase [Phycisphaerae bacterium]
MEPIDPASEETQDLSPGSRTVGARHGGVSRRVPVIAGYQIVRLIGRGGMGEVFEARRHVAAVGIEMTVALKVLNAFSASGRSAERFLNECRILISLQDVPGIARLFDAGLYNDGGVQRPYYAMEYVRGERTLESMLAEPRPCVREMLRFMADVCDAVHSAHLLGVCHLDLKPPNILCDALGSPKVIDFGVSRSAEREGEVERALLGTPEYMAPEQADPRRSVDARSDVYALGVILYEIVSGRRPYPVDRGSRERLVASIVHSEVVRPRRRDGVPAPDRLARIVLRALDKDPAKRFGSAYELGKEIRGYLVNSASLGRGAWGWSAAAAAAACGASVLAWQAGIGRMSDAFVQAPYARWVMMSLPFGPPDSLEKRVRVITFDDETRFERLAEAVGVEGVSDSVGWTRRGVFAKALDRLDGAGAKAVAFDLTFSANPDAERHDGLLAGSIERLKSSGTPVVIACSESVPMGDGAPPGISEAISTAAKRWGDVDLSLDWFMPLAVSPSPDAPFANLSLSLVTVLSAERPGEYPRARFDPDSQTLTYWWESGGRSGLTQPTTNARTMRLKTQAVSVPGNEERLSPRVDGVVLLADMPSRREMDQATLRIDDLLAASADEVRGWCAGRYIIFGNARSDAPDLFDHPRGDRIHGVFAHAAAIDRIATGRYAKLPSAGGDLLTYLSCAAGAAIVFFPLPGGVIRRLSVIGLVSAVITGAGLLAYMIGGWIVDLPGMLFVALVCGIAGVAWHVYVRREIGL